MKALREFLSCRSRKRPTKGMVGEETTWLRLGAIELSSAKFLVADFQFIPSADDGVLIKASPGKYTVAAKGMAYGGDRRVSRLRVLKSGSVPSLGKKVGETWTDTALSAVCDFKALTKECEQLGDDKASDKIQEAYEDAGDCGVFKLGRSGSPVFYVASGFGDGTFPVFELRDGATKVGFEVEFIAPDTVYPFEPFTVEKQPPVSKEEREKAKRNLKTWRKFGDVLESVRAKKTGDEQKDRDTLKQLTTSFLDKLKNEALKELLPLRKNISQARRSSWPLYIKVKEVPKGDWLLEEAVKVRTRALEVEGYAPVGCFHSSAAPDSTRTAYVHPRGDCIATVQRSPRRTWLSLSYLFNDRTSQEFTDFHYPSTISFPDWLQVVSRPELSAEELVRLAEQERRRDGVLITAVAADVAKREEESWLNYVSWLASIGGSSSARLKEIHHLGDKPEDVAALQWERALEVEKSLCNWLRLQPSLPFDLDSVLDSIVMVYDDMRAPQLASAWWSGTEDIGIKEREFEGDSPRQIFAAVNTRRGNKLRLVLQKSSDYQADFYLPNEQ